MPGVYGEPGRFEGVHGHTSGKKPNKNELLAYDTMTYLLYTYQYHSRQLKVL